MQTDMSTMTPNAQSDSSNELSPNLLLDTATTTTTLQVVSVDPKKKKDVYSIGTILCKTDVSYCQHDLNEIIGLDPIT